MNVMGCMSIDYRMSIATLIKLCYVNLPSISFTNKLQDQKTYIHQSHFEKQGEALLCSPLVLLLNKLSKII